MSTDWLKEYVLDIPTLETQEKVICILDKICALIEKRKQQLENLDLLVKSQFIALFGHGQFEQVPISFFVEDKIESAKRKFSGEDVIRYIDISSIDNKMNVMTGFTEYKFKDAPSRAQQCLKCGDVVISTVRPNLKNIAMNNFSYNNLVGSSGFCVLRAKKSSPQYLFGAVLIDEFSRKMSELATGANYPAIKDSDVLAYKIPNAPVALQSQFDSVVEQTGKSKITIKRSLEKLETLKKALMQKYFG